MIKHSLFRKFRWLATLVLLFLVRPAMAQQTKDTLSRPIPADSINKIAQPVRDRKADSALAAFSPRKAIIRSAIIPGWGQIYNKKYWKLPLVYGALGTTGYIFYTNLKTYQDLRYAYKAKFAAQQGDSSLYAGIKAEYIPVQLESLRYNRDNFRRYIDYSVLFFVLFWGLNVVDAAVDAHLKSFDVSPDLALKVKAGYSEMAGTKGVSLVFAFK